MEFKIIIGSLSLLSMVVFIYTGRFWFQIWRREHSGSAHAFFLISVAMLVLVIFELIGIICDIDNGWHNILIWLFIGLNAIFHFAFARGYFNG